MSKLQATFTARRALDTSLLQKIQNFFSHLLRAHQQAFSLSMRTFKTNFFSTILTIFALGILLTMPLGGYILLEHVEKIQNQFQAGTELTIFLKKDVSDNDVNAFIKTLKQHPAFEKIIYQTPDEALQNFKDTMDLKELVNLLPENPLVGVLILYPKLEFQKLSTLQELKKEIGHNSLIDSILLDIEWVQKLKTIYQFIEQLVLLISIFICVGVVIILSNTVKLSLEKHRDEITILNLIGASNAFIRRPFVYRALLQGLFGSLVACCFILGARVILRESLQDLLFLLGETQTNQTIPLKAMLSLIGISLLLSWIAAFLAVFTPFRMK